MRFLDKIFLVVVFLGLAALTTLYFISQRSFENDAVYGSGKVLGGVEILIVGYLLLNLLSWKLDSVITALVLAWIPWTFLSNFEILFNVGWFEWLDLYVLRMLLWPCVYLFFYQFSRRNIPSFRVLVFGFLCLSLYCCFLFAVTYQLREGSGNKWELVLNCVYYPLVTVPWILLIKKPIWRYAGLIILSLIVFFSEKRTALAALVLGTIFYFSTEFLISKKQNRVIKITIGLLLICVWAASYIYVEKEHDYEFSKRILSAKEDEGSGRMIIYRQTINEIASSSWDKLLVGNGHNSVILRVGHSAHNDWLEVLYDFGIGGLALYTLLHALLIRRLYKLIAAKSEYAGAYACCYGILTIMSMVSHLIIYPNYFTYMVAFWGAIEGISTSAPAVARNTAIIYQHKYNAR